MSWIKNYAPGIEDYEYIKYLNDLAIRKICNHLAVIFKQSFST